MSKVKPKGAKLDKNFFHTDNRKERKVEKKAEYIDEDFLDFVRGKLCLVTGCKGLSIPHHIVRKKLGHYDIPVIKNGEYIKGGVVNLCAFHHNLGGIDTSTHQMGDSAFQEKFKVDFNKIAVELWKEYNKEN